MASERCSEIGENLKQGGKCIIGFGGWTPLLEYQTRALAYSRAQIRSFCSFSGLSTPLTTAIRMHAHPRTPTDRHPHRQSHAVRDRQYRNAYLSNDLKSVSR